MPSPPPDSSLRFIAWSRFFSPLVPDESREEAWEFLDFGSDAGGSPAAFWSVFVVGLPAPDVPLLLHAALGRDGNAVREDWMRVIAHLGLAWNERPLPPDHLAAACEVLAWAIEAEEELLVGELCKRYLAPWCEFARARLTERDDALALIPPHLTADLQQLLAAGRHATA